MAREGSLSASSQITGKTMPLASAPPPRVALVAPPAKALVPSVATAAPKAKAKAAAHREYTVASWVMTYFSFIEADRRRILGWDRATYVVVGRENCPETGRPHLQCYLEVHPKCRFSTVQAFLPGAHWEPRRSPDPMSAINYCKKGGSFDNQEFERSAG